MPEVQGEMPDGRRRGMLQEHPAGLSWHTTTSRWEWMLTDRQQDTAELYDDLTSRRKGDKKLQLGKRRGSQETIRKDWWHWCAKMKRKVANNSDVNPPGEGKELSRGPKTQAFDKETVSKRWGLGTGKQKNWKNFITASIWEQEEDRGQSWNKAAEPECSEEERVWHSQGRPGGGCTQRNQELQPFVLRMPLQ